MRPFHEQLWIRLGSNANILCQKTKSICKVIDVWNTINEQLQLYSYSSNNHSIKSEVGKNS